MSQTYFAILTAVGEAKLANAAALNVPLQISRMAVGDGNGNLPVPSRTQTALIGEQYRADLNTLQVDPVNASQIIAELVIPETEGGYWLREMGLYDAAGDLIAVSNCPPSYKPQLAEGSGRTQVLRMVLIVSSTAAVQLKIDPSVVLATRDFVTTTVTDALAKLDGKNSVRVATTGPITLSTTQNIDGVAVVAGNRVLVKNQATGSQNGIYVVAAGAWVRAADADASIEVTPGLFVPVEEGTTNGDSVWHLVTDAPITLGTTSLTFEMLAGRTGVTAGTYRSVTVDKSGNVLGGSNPLLPIAEGGTGASTAAAALAALGGAPLAAAIPGVSSIDSATDFDTINQAGWFPGLLGGAAGSRNAEHPDGQTPVGVGNGVANYYWNFVAKYSSNMLQLGLPYLSGADTSIATIKFRMFGGGHKSPWRALWHSGNLIEASQAEAEAAALTGKWLSPLRALQFIRAAAANATELLRGVLRVGTQAEVDAGTLDDVTVTPKKLFNGALIVTSTYMALKLPSWLGGWILQRGSVAVGVEASGTSSASITLPLAYTVSYSLNATFCYTGSRVENSNVAQPRDKTLSGFTLDNQWVGNGSNLAGTIDFISFGK